MAVPMKNGGMSKLKVIFYVILSGMWLLLRPVRGIFWSFIAWVRKLHINKFIQK